MFTKPSESSGEFFSPSKHPEYVGRLFIVWPTQVRSHTFKPDEGPQTLVDADIAIVDLPNPQTGQPTVFKDATIGGKVLTGQLADRVGNIVLGRLELDNRAYKLASNWTPQDEATAKAYIDTYGRPVAATPQAQPQAAQPPFGAPPVQPQAQAWMPQAQAVQGPPVAAVPATPAVPQPQYAQAAPGVPAAMGAPVAPAAPTGPSQEMINYLATKGIPNAATMTPDQAKMIAASFGDPGAPTA